MTGVQTFALPIFANADDGSCVAIVFGCTDITATNYNAAANMNDGSCTYNTSAPEIDLNNAWKIFPVPVTANQPMAVEYNLNGDFKISISDLNGKELFNTKFNSIGKYVLPVQLNSGMYLMKLTGVDGITSVKTFIVQ